MSFAFARNRYAEAARLRPETPIDPHEIVQQTLKELCRALRVLACAEAEARALPADHLNRALTAIYILQSGLDFEAGGEIAQDLFQLYEFARFHVLRAWRQESEPRLTEAADAIETILSGWQAIAPGSEAAAS